MKTIFITGGSTGIGAAAVRKFVKEGWNVCFMDINAQEAEILQKDPGQYNIRVNAVCAGTIATPLVDNLFKKFTEVENKTVEDYWKEENKLYARGSAGKPEEVAELVYFLAGDSSSFCTGGHYLIDGGLVAR